MDNFKININGTTGIWLHQASKLINNSFYDKYTKLFIVKAFTSLSTPPTQLIKRAVVQKDLKYLEHYYHKENDRRCYAPFINKLIIGKQTNIQAINGKQVEDIPFSFKVVDGKRVLVIGDVKTKYWLKHNLTTYHKVPVVGSDIAAIGIENNRPKYYKLNNKLELVPSVASNRHKEILPTTHESQTVRCLGKMVSAEPVWVEGEPEVSGLYVAGSNLYSRNFLARGSVPDENTEVLGDQTTRVGDNLYYFNAEAEEGSCKWQSILGFYDSGITHYLDFEVAYV